MFRVGTYNVLSFLGFPTEEAEKDLGETLSSKRIEHFAGVIKYLDCDVIGLQEGSVPHRLIQGIAREAGMSVATIPSPGSYSGQVLTRHTILESRTFSHLLPDVREPILSRHGGAVLIEVKGYGRVWVVSLHLHPREAEIREREGDLLADRIDSLLKDGYPMIVLGDFNCEIHERFHELLEDRGFTNSILQIHGEIFATIDTVGKSKHYIDHIYVSHELKDCLRNARVVSESGFRHDGPQVPGLWVHSDHLPVTVDLALY